jgi:hypothetical protein
MSVYEKFTAKNGEPSVYTRMIGNGYFTRYLTWGTGIITKAFLKEKVEKILSNHTKLDDFTVTETDYGWKYERFVKWLDEDGIEYEIVEEGQHTDHEVYTVDISYFEEVTDIFKKLH